MYMLYNMIKPYLHFLAGLVRIAKPLTKAGLRDRWLHKWLPTSFWILKATQIKDFFSQTHVYSVWTFVDLQTLIHHLCSLFKGLATYNAGYACPCCTRCLPRIITFLILCCIRCLPHQLNYGTYVCNMFLVTLIDGMKTNRGCLNSHIWYIT